MLPRPATRCGGVLAGSDRAFDERPTGSDAPMLFIHGDADNVLGIDEGRAAYREVRWPKAFLALEGGGHVEPYVREGADFFDVVSTATTAFLLWTLRSERDALDTLRDVEAEPNVVLTDDLDRR